MTPGTRGKAAPAVDRGLSEARLRALQSELDDWVKETGAIVPGSSWHCELAAMVDRAAALAASAPSQAEPIDGQPLRLWQNGDHYLAFKHLYPCHSPGGDPMTLGEPFGRAIFRSSFNREGKSNERQSNDGQGAWNSAQPDVQRRHATGGSETHAAGAGASTGYAQCAAAQQAQWNASDYGAWPVEIPDASRALGVLAAQGAVAGGVIAPSQAGSCQASEEAWQQKTPRGWERCEREYFDHMVATGNGHCVRALYPSPPAGRTLTDAEALAELTRAATVHGMVLQRSNLTRWSVPELQAEIGRLQQALTLRVCGDPVAGIGFKVGAESSTTAGECDHG